MRSQAQADWISYGEHFNLPSHMEMRSYEGNIYSARITQVYYARLNCG